MRSLIEAVIIVIMASRCRGPIKRLLGVPQVSRQESENGPRRNYVVHFIVFFAFFNLILYFLPPLYYRWKAFLRVF